jgi:hypothetical protein
MVPFYFSLYICIKNKIIIFLFLYYFFQFLFISYFLIASTKLSHQISPSQNFKSTSHTNARRIFLLRRRGLQISYHFISIADFIWNYKTPTKHIISTKTLNAHLVLELWRTKLKASPN